MAIFPGLIGPFAQDRFLTFDAERTENLFLRGSSAGMPKAQAELIKRPGLTPLTALASGPVRALFAQDGRCFAVSGATFGEIFADGLTATWGSVGVDSNPATISSNGTAGNQLFITSGGLGYTFDLVNNDLLQITDPAFPSPALMGCFDDGYFVVLKALSRQFYISTLEDGTTWNGLDVAEVSTASENLVAMGFSHRELWLFGSKTTQVWYDSGDAGFPFQPIQGVFIQQGCGAPWSPVLLDNALYWVGANELGGGTVYRADGYRPDKISTYAVDTYINALGRYDDAIGWGFQMEGHTFYVLYLPQAKESLVYDVSTGQWCLWCVWDPDWLTNRPHLGRCACYAFGKLLVGDRQSGAVYEQSLDTWDDTLNLGTGF